MATFFGEILSVTSRAVDEDEDEENRCEITSPCRMRWCPQIRAEMEQSPGRKLDCAIMIVSAGAAASGFSSSYILHDNFDTVGALFSGMDDHDVNTFSQTSATDKTCYLYRSQRNKKMFVCQCNTVVQPEQAYSWVTELFSDLDINGSDVVILSTALTSIFKSEVPISELSTPFVRALWTGQCKGTSLFPSVEQPNVVCGLPAQILSYCQVQNVRAMLYVCYRETTHIDFSVLKSFQPILNYTPLKGTTKGNPKASEMLKKIVDLHANHNSLYL